MGQLNAVIILMLILPLCSGNASGTKVSSNQFEPQTTELNLTIDFGNETTLEFPSVNGTSVLNATKSVVSVETEWYGDSVFVTSIGGVSNDPEAGLWWQYWVNDELGPVAANKYIPQPGDEIAWRRAPPQNTNESGIGIDISTVAALLLLPVVGIGVLLFLRNKRME